MTFRLKKTLVFLAVTMKKENVLFGKFPGRKPVELEIKLQLRHCLAGLTPAEERVCLLMGRGCSNSEIAHILQILPESVCKTRYRLRKRIGLHKGESLEKWVEDCFRDMLQNYS